MIEMLSVPFSAYKYNSPSSQAVLKEALQGMHPSDFNPGVDPLLNLNEQGQFTCNTLTEKDLNSRLNCQLESQILEAPSLNGGITQIDHLHFSFRPKAFKGPNADVIDVGWNVKKKPVSKSELGITALTKVIRYRDADETKEDKFSARFSYGKKGQCQPESLYRGNILITSPRVCRKVYKAYQKAHAALKNLEKCGNSYGELLKQLEGAKEALTGGGSFSRSLKGLVQSFSKLNKDKAKEALPLGQLVDLYENSCAPFYPEQFLAKQPKDKGPSIIEPEDDEEPASLPFATREQTGDANKI